MRHHKLRVCTLVPLYICIIHEKVQRKIAGYFVSRNWQNKVYCHGLVCVGVGHSCTGVLYTVHTCTGQWFWVRLMGSCLLAVLVIGRVCALLIQG